MRMKIAQCGGKRVAHMDVCDIILIEKPAHDDEEEEYWALTEKHAIDPRVRVENPSWVDDCMEARRLVQHPSKINFGVNNASRSRYVTHFTSKCLTDTCYSGVPFTPREDAHLARYLGA